MKNSALAPIILLLGLLALAWGGLFGLAEVSTNTTAERTPRSTAPITSSPSRAAPAERDPAPSRERVGDSERRDPSQDSPGFLDRLAGRDSPGTAGNDTARTNASDNDGLQGFLNRLAQRDPATDAPSADPGGLSPRGATALIVVILLVALLGGAKKRR